ncbi:MAG: hypothetical protein JKY96_08755, partial [Phycisphaerales bacterium]|nr:hypothetical protein [Phycisphaerales bacterium]
DLGGLVVRWVDTPGMDDAVDDDDAVMIAAEMVRRADLVVHCVDAGEQERGIAGVGMDARLAEAISPTTPIVVVRTRADRGGDAGLEGIRTSSLDGSGLGDLVSGVRDVLVPPAVLGDRRPWRFWAD